MGFLLPGTLLSKINLFFFSGSGFTFLSRVLLELTSRLVLLLYTHPGPLADAGGGPEAQWSQRVGAWGSGSAASIRVSKSPF